MTRKSNIFLLAVLLSGLACREDPQAAKRRLVANGDTYVAHRNYSGAVVEYRKALARDGSFGEARFKLGNAYVLSHDPINALHEYVRAADLMPTNVEAQLAAGRLLLIAGQFPEAKARAMAALAKEPKNVEALSLMGNALAGMKDIDGAISQLEEAIEADPARTLIFDNIGLLQQSRGNAAAAEAAFKRAVEVQPKSARAHLSLANYYWASTQPDNAEREFKAAYELDPKSVSATRALAAFYLLNNKPVEGERFLKAYASLAPDSAPKLVLADFYFKATRPKEALAVLEPLLKEKDGFAPAKMRIAANEFISNQREQAYRSIDEVLKREPKNEAALLEKSRFLQTDHRSVEALVLSRKVVADNPASAAGHFLNGSALEAAGSNDEALKEYLEVLRLRPSAAPALTRAANLYLNQGDAAGAAALVTQALKSRPQAGGPHFLLARALLRLGDLGAAESEIAALVKNEPNSAVASALLGDLYWARKDVPRAHEAYAKALTQDERSMDALTGVIKTNLVQNKKDEARAKVEARLATAPRDTSVLLLAGDTYMALGDATRAESAYRRLLDVDPANIDAYERLGIVYMSQNRLEDAKKSYEEGAHNQPKAAVPATTMVGIILALQSKPAEARQQYQRALALDPQAAVAANNLAWDYAENGGASLDVALQLAQTAKRKLPNSWQASDTLGWIYYKKGLASLAVTTLNQSVGQNPSNPTLQYHLGLAHLKAGSPTDARKALNQALKLDPKFDAADDAKRVLATIKG